MGRPEQGRDGATAVERRGGGEGCLDRRHHCRCCGHQRKTIGVPDLPSMEELP
jgi:hypothetical protein